MKRNPPVYKGQIIVYEITGQGKGASGVGKLDGFTIFTPYAVLGEIVEVEITRVKKTYAEAALRCIVKPHIDRVDPPCPIFQKCGGCQSQHLAYEAQLNMKYQHVVDCFRRIGGFTGVKVHPVLGMETPWEYRNKVAVPFGKQGGEMVAGFYAARSHDIVDMDTCIIQHQEIDRVIAGVKGLVEGLGVLPYDEKKHHGILRHVVVRIGVNTGEMMVVLVTHGNHLPYCDEIVEYLRKEFPAVRSIIQNINTKRTNVILGETNRLLWGSEVIFDTIGTLRFAISSHSFFQINVTQTKVLYDRVLQYANLTGRENLLDAYCGIGTIALYLAPYAGKVYGVEIVPQAIRDARKNASLNKQSHTVFEAGAADKVMMKWYQEGVRPDVIVVDPPRKGCEPEVLDMMAQMMPKRLIYVSCNPATLARDAKILVDQGFSITEVQPVDMFPQTEHVECVVLFE